MRFTTFLKSIKGHEDSDIKLFLRKANAYKNFPLSSDPRILALFLFNKLNEQQTLGFQKCIMLYSIEPKNQLPKDLNDKQNFLNAINAIINFQNNPDLLSPEIDL